MRTGKASPIEHGIDPEVKAAAEEAAIADRRSLSSLVEKLLTDYCREHGFLKLERKAKRS
jgi:hypothetical protein